MVIYGGERVFAAGADIKEMAEAMAYTEMAAHGDRLQAAFTAVAAIPKPVVAAITGYALGGGLELALCADFRIAGEGAKVGQPEILLGIIPGAGGTQRLARLIGPAKAKNLIFTGRHGQGRRGAADRPGRPGRPRLRGVLPAPSTGPRSFADGPALALRAAKQAIDAGLDVDLDTGLEIERLHFAGLFATEDQRAACAASWRTAPARPRSPAADPAAPTRRNALPAAAPPGPRNPGSPVLRARHHEITKDRVPLGRVL